MPVSKLEIKKIDLWSLFKLAFFIYAIIGLFFGLIYFFFMVVLGGINSAYFADEFPQFGFVGGLVGLFLIPFLAFIYGIFGSVFITIGGWIYNLIAGLAGGLRVQAIEIVEVRQEQRTPSLSQSPGTEAHRDSGAEHVPGGTAEEPCDHPGPNEPEQSS